MPPIEGIFKPDPKVEPPPPPPPVNEIDDDHLMPTAIDTQQRKGDHVLMFRDPKNEELAAPNEANDEPDEVEEEEDEEEQPVN